MSSTLIRNPLRTSLSMISGHDDVVVTPPTNTADQPLGYLYSRWDPGTVTEEEAALGIGYYDPDKQVWITPDGAITAGIYTKTQTSGCPGDCPTDDVCA